MIHIYENLGFSFEPPLLSSNRDLIQALGEHDAVKSGLDTSQAYLFSGIHEAGISKITSHTDLLAQHLGTATGSTVTISPAR